ncbi:MAG: D-hexose-6-phosphate mutarotase [Pseudomonadota bacterium]
MTSAEQLNRQFGIDGKVRLVERGDGFVMIEVRTAQGQADIALQGAHVTTWAPQGQAPVVWVSEQAKYAAGKSIRGGVPVCWPWFGPHASNAKLPGHGYARTVDWRLLRVTSLDDGRIQLIFELIDTPATRAQESHPLRVRNTVTVGASLQVELETTNLGTAPYVLGDALHTYFHVGDVTRATVHGLEGCAYIDKVDGGARKQQGGPVTIAGEVDRIYLGTGNCCEIRDPVLQRRIVIRSRNSASTIVWNPGVEKATKMGDFGSDGYLRMLCVETANAAEDVVNLAPGAQHRLVAEYSCAGI